MADSITGQTRPRLRPWVRTRREPATGKTALVFPEGMLELNETGSQIIELCDGARPFDDVVTLLAAKFDAPPELLRADVSEYLLRLRAKGLLELVEPA